MTGASPSLRDALDEPTAGAGIHVPRRRDGWDTYRYTDVMERAGRVTASLLAAGSHGVPVAIVARESWETGVALLGAIGAGAMPVVLRSRRPLESHDRYQSEIASLMASVGAALVIVGDGMARSVVPREGRAPFAVLTLAELLDSPRATRNRFHPSLAFIQLTSGSTGAPKPLAVSWENLASAVHALSTWLDVTPDDSAASWLPLHHDMGLIGFFVMPVVHRADLWLLSPDDFLRQPVRWLECFGRLGASIAACPPFGLRYCVDRVSDVQLEGLDLAGWRATAVGAERVDARTLTSFAAKLEPYGLRRESLLPAYGLAEATLAVTATRPGDGVRAARLNLAATAEHAVVAESSAWELDGTSDRGASWTISCGPAVAGCTVAVVDEHGDPVDDGTVGEIVVAGPMVLRELHAELAPEQLRTGDAGVKHHGDLFVLGRMGDSLSVNGTVLYAEQLEAAVAEQVGLPGRFAVALGTTASHDLVVVAVESRAPLGDTGEQVVRTIRARVAPETVVRLHRVGAGAIPLTSSGKPRRRELWRLARDGPPFDGPVD